MRSSYGAWSIGTDAQQSGEGAMPTRRFVNVCCTVASLLLIPPVSASEIWPAQPYHWHDHPGRGEKASGAFYPGMGAVEARRWAIHSGQFFPIRALGGIFFKTRLALNGFVDNGDLGKYTFLLSNLHFVRAEDDIGALSDGGRVYDDFLGHGFLLMPPNNKDPIPIPITDVSKLSRLPFQIRPSRPNRPSAAIQTEAQRAARARVERDF